MGVECHEALPPIFFQNRKQYFPKVDVKYRKKNKIVIMLHIENNVTIVTGGTSGIGYAVSKLFTEYGGKVVAASSRQESVDKTIAEIGCDGLAVDLSQRSECKRLVDYTIEKYGRVDILINNAGIQHVCKLEEFPEDKWQFMMDLMLNAPFYLIKDCIPSMKAQGWGRIINIDSIQGLVASPFKSCYVTAKHGLNGLTMAAALELGAYGITVNSICPAYVDTPLVQKQIAAQARENNIPEGEVISDIMLKNSAIKRLLDPEEVAKVAKFLCSDGASMITGASIPLDGGWTAS